jgi:dephospho-CoA kinase
VVLDAAVLFEAGCEDACTHCVFVDAPAAVRKRRVTTRRGWTEREWQRREKAQFSLDRKRARCDYTIENGFSVPRLRQQIRQLFHRIRVDVD